MEWAVALTDVTTNLAWAANTEPDLDHYGFYRGIQDDKYFPINWSSSPVATTVNTSWTDPSYKHDATAPSFILYRITAFR